ncbi:hypothetical protein HPB51_016194 [Rhipicephalus microplus]|uniref:Secreted protein n=1 Tax=Rhipicephalus microplus TaxID=6941 RepID=A0A9J6E1H7_RHIMP|nr:hypothetical protein HPB51_016194 [Rhipicephalus microplus]
MRSLLCFQALLLSVVSAAPTSDTQRPATEAITTATDSADYSYRRITLDPVSATTGAWGVTSPVKLLIYPTLMTENFSGPGETAVGRALNMRSLLCFQALLLSVVSAAPTSDTQRPATEAITTATDRCRLQLPPHNTGSSQRHHGSLGSDVTSEAAYIPDADDRKLQWARRNRSRQSSEHAFFIVHSG